jgi:diphosphomevalonate decarboxylase
MSLKQRYLDAILGKMSGDIQCLSGSAFAPSNIALCKYWGKRSLELHLPHTDSLSISLGDYGAFTRVTLAEEDSFILNGELVDVETRFYRQVFSFINLFRGPNQHRFAINSDMNIPASAGVASSACGFAALTLALNQLFGWNLSLKELSLLARLGSGSACRSLWHGFVHWHRGERDDGLDCYAERLDYDYPQLRVGLVFCSFEEKKYSSRQAMLETTQYSRLYRSWGQCVQQDLKAMFVALETGSLIDLFAVAERNALAMHATMLDLPRPIMYMNEKTYAAVHLVWNLREQGLPVYYTQDAGPNIVLLFEKNYEHELKNFFPQMMIVTPQQTLDQEKVLH